MKILVTGATSMLGRAVALALIGRGDTVTVCQRGSSGLDCAEVRGDLSLDEVQTRAVAGQDGIIHLAAKVDVTGRAADFYRVNVQATRGLLAAARAAGTQRVVYVSSPSVAHGGRALFGVVAGPADPDTARGHYARSKAVAENLALGADSPTTGRVVTAIRPHLVWGPGDTQLVGRIVARAQAGRLALIGGGGALIDTTYLDNAVHAIVAAYDRCPAVHGQALVVSNGEPRPVAEIIARLCDAAGVNRPRLHIPYPAARLAGAVVEGAWALRSRLGNPGEAPMTRFLAEQLATAHWFDQRRTRELLGWSPAVSLEQGFERLAASFAAVASDAGLPR